MFLGELEKEEKEAFLELAFQIANVDGNLSIFEENVLNKYQKEMDLETYKVKGLPFETCLKVFKDQRSKDIVLTELLQLIFADGVYHDEERKSVQLIKAYFGYESDEFESFKDWIDKIKELSLG